MTTNAKMWLGVGAAAIGGTIVGALVASNGFMGGKKIPKTTKNVAGALDDESLSTVSHEGSAERKETSQTSKPSLASR